MQDQHSEYGIIVCVKAKPGFKLNEKRLEHSTNSANLELLAGLAERIYVVFIERNSNMVLGFEYGAIPVTSHDQGTGKAIYVPRDSLSDLTELLREETDEDGFQWEMALQHTLATAKLALK
jgi:hypothetical protein